MSVCSAGESYRHLDGSPKRNYVGDHRRHLDRIGHLETWPNRNPDVVGDRRDVTANLVFSTWNADSVCDRISVGDHVVRVVGSSLAAIS